MKFRELNSEDLVEVSNFVWMIFSEFIAREYSLEGIETFRKFIEPKELEKLLKSKNFLIMGCFEKEKMIGVIAVKDFCHISLLFVDKAYHRKGIAKELFAKTVKRCMQENPKIKEITVNSSSYAVEIYERLGFKQMGPQTTKDGITFVPMKICVESFK